MSKDKPVVVVSISFDPDLLIKLDLKRGDINRSKFVNKLVGAGLDA